MEYSSNATAEPHTRHRKVENPRSRAPEFYGFVAWTSTSLAFCLYILWALIPDKYIIWVGIDWYPNREWALLLPAYSIILVITTYFSYSAMAIASTPSFSDMNAITDTRVLFPPNPHDQNNPYINAGQSSELYDIPIGLVNRVLYGPESQDT